MAIEFPGTEIVSPNHVYVSDVTVKDNYAGFLMKKGVIALNRFVQANDQQVVDYLQRKSEELKDVGKELEGMSKLERELIGLPEEVKEGIRDNEAFRNYLKIYTSATASNDMLRVKCGVIPYQLVEEAKKIAGILYPEWYEKNIVELCVDVTFGYDVKRFPKAVDSLFKGLNSSTEDEKNQIEEFRNIFNHLVAGLTTRKEFRKIHLNPSLARPIEGLALEPLIIIKKAMPIAFQLMVGAKEPKGVN